MKGTFVRIVNGNLQQYLKNIDIYGRIDESGKFVVWGCKNIDQPRFYKALLDMDKADPVQGWETVEEVKDWWENEADMLLWIDEGCFEEIEGS